MANGFDEENNFGYAGPSGHPHSSRAGGAGSNGTNDAGSPGGGDGAEYSEHSGRAAGSGEAADTGAGVAVAAEQGTQDPEQIREALAGKHVCPFCGSINEAEQGVCPRCTMENNGATRKATKSRIGPWYVLQTRNPAAPGMKFETLLNFVHKGRVKPRSIVRGPTTHQLWKFAAQVKGLSREFGVCYSCGGVIDTAASLCPQCNRLQDPPANPDVLLETKDAPAPAPATRPGRFKEPDLAEVDAEFVVPALGTGSEDSVSGVTLTGSMAGIAFDPTAFSRSDANSGRKKDEGFLSPKDLAAAFKLNFSPQAEAEGAAPAARPFPPAGERRRPPRESREARDVPEPRPMREPAARLPREPRGRAQRPVPPQSLSSLAVDSSASFGSPFDADAREAMAPARPARKKFNPMEVASEDAPPPRRHRLLKVMSFLVVFTAGLFAAAVYFDADLRQQLLQLYGQARQALLHEGNSDKPDKSDKSDKSDKGPVGPRLPKNSASPGTATPAVPSTPTPAASAAAGEGTDDKTDKRSSADSDPDVPDASAPPSTAVPAAAVSPKAGQAASRPSADSTADASQDGSHGRSRVEPPVALVHSSPAPASPSTSQPVSPPAPAAPASRPSAPTGPSDPAPAPRAPFDSAAAGAEALKLYRDAMSLEGSDPAKAIVKYKAIKLYPREVWPGDLDVCIRRAELRLKLQQ